MKKLAIYLIAAALTFATGTAIGSEPECGKPEPAFEAWPCGSAAAECGKTNPEITVVYMSAKAGQPSRIPRLRD